eukprot:GEMP01076615.1.p1 GENE.GEMP01076615.1~~GEMP01076615.1.p1  ORF type:complete len:213 (+),score=34.45 GEMP01076615.1:65-703(+)
MKFLVFALSLARNLLRENPSIIRPDPKGPFNVYSLVGFHAKSDHNTKENEPVGMQISRSQLDPLLKALSIKCRERYSNIISGRAPSPFEFDAARSDAKKQCAKLEGSMCAIRTGVQGSTELNGRQLSQRVVMSGNGCIPNECLAETDLKPLANFMRTQSVEAGATQSHPIAEAETKVTLSVDCSAVGGGSVSSPQTPLGLVTTPKESFVSQT